MHQINPAKSPPVLLLTEATNEAKRLGKPVYLFQCTGLEMGKKIVCGTTRFTDYRGCRKRRRSGKLEYRWLLGVVVQVKVRP